MAAITMTYTQCTLVGMDDMHCNVSVVTFKSGSEVASVNIPLVDDNTPECDETFTAHIIFLRDGFRLGQHPSISITILDEGNNDVPLLLF